MIISRPSSRLSLICAPSWSTNDATTECLPVESVHVRKSSCARAAEQIIAASKSKYGKALCMDCAQKAKAAAEAEAKKQEEIVQDDLAAQLMADAE